MRQLRRSLVGGMATTQDRRSSIGTREQFADHFGSTNLVKSSDSPLGLGRCRCRGASQRSGDHVRGCAERRLSRPTRSPTFDFPLAREPSNPPPGLEEYRAILAACPILGGYGPEFRAMFSSPRGLAFATGELQALRWEDIQPDTVWIRRARKRDGTEKEAEKRKERGDRVVAAGSSFCWTICRAATIHTSSIRRAASHLTRARSSMRGELFARPPD